MGLVQHPTFYLPLGDLIVQSAADAEGTSTLFRVNKSLLAFNSPIFADMFALPTTSTQDLYDGAPLVQVTDTAEELAALFSALYDPSSLCLPRFDPGIPIRLTGVMRLATKYQIDTIRNRIVDIMNDNWPQTYEQWRIFQAEISAIKAVHKENNGLVDGRSFEERIPEPAAAIRFARDFNIPSILPFAFYTLAGIPQYMDWDESREVRDFRHLVTVTLMKRTAKWGQLDIVDYRTFAKCREALTNDVVEIMVHFGREEEILENSLTERCFNDPKGECSRSVVRLHNTWHIHGPYDEEARADAASIPDPLGLLQRFYDTQTDWQACRDCQERMQKYIRKAQKLVWDSITQLTKYI